MHALSLAATPCVYCAGLQYASTPCLFGSIGRGYWIIQNTGHVLPCFKRLRDQLSYSPARINMDIFLDHVDKWRCKIIICALKWSGPLSYMT